MIAYITSIGETTTDLSKWSLERLGFTAVVLKSPTTLWEKLYRIFTSHEGDILRVDADVVVNKNILELVKQKALLWYQPQVFDWYKQDISYGGIQFIRGECIPIIRKHIKEAEFKERPETYLSRLDEFFNPRVFGNFDLVCGLNGYRQADVKRVKETKLRRGQYNDYDFELAEALDALA